MFDNREGGTGARYVKNPFLSPSAEADSKCAAPQGVAQRELMQHYSERFEREFEVLKVLGKGKFGSVLRVRHKLDEKLYALKVCEGASRTATFRDTEGLREVFAMSRLSGVENVVQYYSAWVQACKYHSRPEDLYLQMELCNGCTAHFITERQRCCNRTIRDILCDIANGLAGIHNHRIAHLDLKPDNIMYKYENSGAGEHHASKVIYKIGDFGCCCSTAARLGESTDATGDHRYMPKGPATRSPQRSTCTLWGSPCAPWLRAASPITART